MSTPGGCGSFIFQDGGCSVEALTAGERASYIVHFWPRAGIHGCRAFAMEAMGISCFLPMSTEAVGPAEAKPLAGFLQLSETLCTVVLLVPKRPSPSSPSVQQCCCGSGVRVTGNTTPVS